MSQPSASCPVEVAELMHLTVFWESFLGFDGHAEPSYATGITLDCWQEEGHGFAQRGVHAVRNATDTTSKPDFDLYFSGDDANARQIKLYDRFTPDGVGAENMPLQPFAIDTVNGPNFDSVHPWLIIVTF